MCAGRKSGEFFFQNAHHYGIDKFAVDEEVVSEEAFLLEAGADELSVSTPYIARVKEKIRSLD